MDDLIADFLTETNESLADLDVALVKLERTPDDQDTLSLIFRLVHTIKGTCGFLGLPRLEKVAHAAESVLGKVRDGVLTATPDTVSIVLAALDRVKAIVSGLAATGNEQAGDDSELIAALDAAAAGHAPVVAQEAPSEPQIASRSRERGGPGKSRPRAGGPALWRSQHRSGAGGTEANTSRGRRAGPSQPDDPGDC